MGLTRSGFAIAATLATMVLGASAAAASPGYVTTSLNLRSGPSTSYPPVVVMHAGDPVEIYGCMPGWSWCDINWNGYRGWAAGRYLQVYYANARRPITNYGVYFSIPSLSFSIGSYWNQHYRNRPFYSQMYKFGGPPQGGGYKPPFVSGPPKPPPFYSGPPRYQGPPQFQYKPPYQGGPYQGGPPPFQGPPQFQYKPPGKNTPFCGGQGQPQCGLVCPQGQYERDGACVAASGG